VSNKNVIRDYRNDQVIERYLHETPVERKYALQTFEEMKKFLYACSKSSEPLSPSKPVDEMWHQFLLFSIDYEEYCEKYMDIFVHHIPSLDAKACSSAYEMAQKKLKEIFGSIDYEFWPNNPETIGVCKGHCHSPSGFPVEA